MPSDHLAVAVGLVAVSLGQVAAQSPYPNVGIHTGSNRISWTTGCCDGDMVVIDFRDENADGNEGSGLLRLSNATGGTVATYEIPAFWGLWKSFGPYCAPAGAEHTFTFTSDANAVETTVTITDSFGLVKAKGGMDDFPMVFNTTAPSKWCIPAELGLVELPEELRFERARKIVAAHHQYHSRAELEKQGFITPADEGYSVIDLP